MKEKRPGYKDMWDEVYAKLSWGSVLLKNILMGCESFDGMMPVES